MPKLSAKLLFIVGGVFILLALLFGNVAHAVDDNFRNQMLEPVIKIDQQCSGTIISSRKKPDGDVETIILTAKHCVDKTEGVLNIEITDKGRPIYDKNVWYDVDRKSPSTDLAKTVLRDTETVYPVAHIAESLAIEMGDDVYVVGFPLGKIRTITRGMFTGYQYVEKKSFLRATPDATFGNSGGALFQRNGDNYELIGVTSMRYRDNTFMGLFVPIDDIRAFIRVSAFDVSYPETLP